MNNGSTDDTKNILKNLSNEEYLKYINLRETQGMVVVSSQELKNLKQKL